MPKAAMTIGIQITPETSDEAFASYDVMAYVKTNNRITSTIPDINIPIPLPTFPR